MSLTRRTFNKAAISGLISSVLAGKASANDLETVMKETGMTAEEIYREQMFNQLSSNKIYVDKDDDGKYPEWYISRMAQHVDTIEEQRPKAWRRERPSEIIVDSNRRNRSYLNIMDPNEDIDQRELEKELYYDTRKPYMPEASEDVKIIWTFINAANPKEKLIDFPIKKIIANSPKEAYQTDKDALPFVTDSKGRFVLKVPRSDYFKFITKYLGAVNEGSEVDETGFYKKKGYSKPSLEGKVLRQKIGIVPTHVVHPKTGKLVPTPLDFMTKTFGPKANSTDMARVVKRWEHGSTVTYLVDDHIYDDPIGRQVLEAILFGEKPSNPDLARLISAYTEFGRSHPDILSAGTVKVKMERALHKDVSSIKEAGDINDFTIPVIHDKDLSSLGLHAEVYNKNMTVRAGLVKLHLPQDFNVKWFDRDGAAIPGEFLVWAHELDPNFWGHTDWTTKKYISAFNDPLYLDIKEKRPTEFPDEVVSTIVSNLETGSTAKGLEKIF